MNIAIAPAGAPVELAADEVVLVRSANDTADPHAPLVCEALPLLRAGVRLQAGGRDRFLVEGGVQWPGARPRLMLRAFEDVKLSESSEFEGVVGGKSLAWITLSDKGWAGQRTDESGPAIERLMAGYTELSITRGHLLPDEEPMLRALLVDLALTRGFDFVMTTGGTGLTPRDVAPEATLAVIEKRLPGFERAMTAAGLAKTPHAAVSRAVAGTLGRTIIVNMPGSPKAVQESVEAIGPALVHAHDKLCGDPSDCART